MTSTSSSWPSAFDAFAAIRRPPPPMYIFGYRSVVLVGVSPPSEAGTQGGTRASGGRQLPVHVVQTSKLQWQVGLWQALWCATSSINKYIAKGVLATLEIPTPFLSIPVMSSRMGWPVVVLAYVGWLGQRPAYHLGCQRLHGDLDPF
jgi:hypothetical protein